MLHCTKLVLLVTTTLLIVSRTAVAALVRFGRRVAAVCKNCFPAPTALAERPDTVCPALKASLLLPVRLRRTPRPTYQNVRVRPTLRAQPVPDCAAAGAHRLKQVRGSGPGRPARALPA